MMFRQKFRRACRNAIGGIYNEPIKLCAERMQKRIYYSVWHVGQDLVEAYHMNGRVELYCYSYSAKKLNNDAKRT